MKKMILTGICLAFSTAAFCDQAQTLQQQADPSTNQPTDKTNGSLAIPDAPQPAAAAKAADDPTLSPAKEIPAKVDRNRSYLIDVDEEEVRREREPKIRLELDFYCYNHERHHDWPAMIFMRGDRHPTYYWCYYRGWQEYYDYYKRQMRDQGDTDRGDTRGRYSPNRY